MATNDSLQLLKAASATDSTNTFKWTGGRGAFLVDGTFGGTSVSLEYQGPTGTWFTVGTDTTKTAAGMAGFELPPGNIRASITGGAGVSVTAWVIGTRTA